MKNSFTQTRKFMMNMYGVNDREATTIITQGVNFGMTQLVDGNWGVHGVIPKTLVGAAPFTGTGPTADLATQFPAVKKLPLNKDNVHWGYFSKDLAPVATKDTNE